MAITAAMSGDLDEGWFDAQYNTPEEAKAMYATHKARRTIEQSLASPGVENG